MKALPSACWAIAIAGLAFGCSSVKKTMVTSVWQEKPIVIDGKLDEWEQPLKYSNNATALAYSIANDGDNLYFVFMTTDRRTHIKITMGGLLIRLNFPGTETKPATLLYPIPGMVDFEKHPPGGGGGGRGQGALKFNLAEQANALQVSGFPFSPAESQLPLMNSFGVNVATNVTADQQFIYEAVLPLKGLKMNDNQLDIAITVKGIPRDKIKQPSSTGGTSAGGYGANGGMGGSPGGMPGGMGGRGRFGGGGYGGQSSGSSGYSAAFTDLKMAVSMKLASK